MQQFKLSQDEKREKAKSTKRSTKHAKVTSITKKAPAKITKKAAGAEDMPVSSDDGFEDF
ncbi:MAG TPA: hypothetical protein VGK02_10710 [Candidatus Aquicultor sp.]|jgi:hypothetical protein